METENGTIGKALIRLNNKFKALDCSHSVEDMVDFILSSHQEHWKWRLTMAQVVTDSLNFEKYGIQGVYIIGSTKNAVAGPSSDIDLLVHHHGDEKQVKDLEECIEAWGQVLSDMNFYRTGLKTHCLIDLHLITDADIINKTSYAVLIGRASHGAKLLKVRK